MNADLINYSIDQIAVLAKYYKINVNQPLANVIKLITELNLKNAQKSSMPPKNAKSKADHFPILNKMSQPTRKWLSEWLAMTDNDPAEFTELLTLEIITELQHIQKEYGGPIDNTLYRGSETKLNNGNSFKTITSTSYSLDIASGFGEYIYEFNPTENDILIDTTIFTPKELSYMGVFSAEREVILLPGNYIISEFLG